MGARPFCQTEFRWRLNGNASAVAASLIHVVATMSADRFAGTAGVAVPADAHRGRRPHNGGIRSRYGPGGQVTRDGGGLNGKLHVLDPFGTGDQFTL